MEATRKIYLNVITFVEKSVEELDRATKGWMAAELSYHGRSFKIIEMTGYAYEGEHYRSIIYKF